MTATATRGSEAVSGSADAPANAAQSRHRQWNISKTRLAIRRQNAARGSKTVSHHSQPFKWNKRELGRLLKRIGSIREARAAWNISLSEAIVLRDRIAMEPVQPSPLAGTLRQQSIAGCTGGARSSTIRGSERYFISFSFSFSSHTAPRRRQSVSGTSRRLGRN